MSLLTPSSSSKSNLGTRWAHLGSRLPGRKKQSLLLSIPSELRLQIFGYVLSSQSACIVPYKDAPKYIDRKSRLKDIATLSNKRQGLSPVYFWTYQEISDNFSQKKSIVLVCLLQTCKQIHAEAKPLFYRLNTFELDPCLFIARTGLLSHLTDWIRHVWIIVEDPDYSHGVTLTSHISALLSLLAATRKWCENGVLETVGLRVKRSIIETCLSLITGGWSFEFSSWSQLLVALREDRDWYAHEQAGLRPRKLRRRLEFACPYLEFEPGERYGEVFRELRDAYGAGS